MAERTPTPQEFANRWSKSGLSERSGAQQHFLDLCRMLGHTTPVEADPEGDFFTFEKGVTKSGTGSAGDGKDVSGKGFADVFYRDRFAWEYKGKHKDLAAAYDQLLRYREDLENPPLLVVSDMDRFEIHTNFTRTAKKVYSFSNAEIAEPENLRVLRALFEDPDSLRPERTPEGVTEQAAAKFATLADGLRARGVDPEKAAHFLNKLLFCLFAEDVEILPRGLFTRVADRTRNDPERFAQYAGDLFRSMSGGGDFLLEDIRHFNGGLFADAEVIPLEPKEIKLVAEAGRLDWGSVEPAIFGTLFERSLDPSQRAQLGAHYTSRADILTIVEPVLMAPLRRQWEQAQEEVRDISEKMHPTDKASRNRSLRQMNEKIVGFLEELRSIRVLDPACGSGNFLYVSLKRLLELEKEVATFSEIMGIGHFFPEVSPEQLHGIETSTYAHELAQVSIWIGYLQWMVDNGFGARREPVLGPMTNILEMDAIVERDGELRDPEWPEAEVIVGNPPFLGGSKLRRELGDEYLEALFQLYGGRVPGFADLVCYWFERARKEIEIGRADRAGLLATNSIRGGASRRVLERIKQSGDIFFAYSDREWILDGAAVRVSMVGFDDGRQQERMLDGLPAQNINPDLTATVDLASASKLPENKNLACYGSQQKGSFDISHEKAQQFLSEPAAFGKNNREVVKPAFNGREVLQRTNPAWVIDFGLDTPLEEAALYEGPFEYVRRVILPERLDRREKRQREYWWLHARPSPKYRKILREQDKYIATPAVSKHRIFVWLDSSSLADHALVIFALEDDYSFGVLHSRAHELWALRMGTFLGKGNDPRYTPTTCFETFPFPNPTDEQRLEIADAARVLDQRRRGWLDPPGASEAELKKRTLTNLYNERPTWLAMAHERLDSAVYAAYGWTEAPGELVEEEILKRLLTLNRERANPDRELERTQAES